MLTYRATATRPGQPAQKRYTPSYPSASNLEISREGQIAQKQTQRDDYDRTAKKLQDVQQFQSVRFQLDPKKPIWQ